MKFLASLYTFHFLEETSCLMEPESQICFNFTSYCSCFPFLFFFTNLKKKKKIKTFFFSFLNAGKKWSFHDQSLLGSSFCGHLSQC